MRRPAAALLLALAACSSPPAPHPTAPVTIFGEHPGLEMWDAETAADRHLHPREGSDCAGIAALTAAIANPELGHPVVNDARARFPAIVESLLAQIHGAPYGGPARLTLALRHHSEGRKEADRALFVVIPTLAPGEAGHTFRDREVSAEYHEPLLSVKASLESGRVHARRLDGGGFEFELFLVLRSPEGERLQVVTRAGAPAPR